MMAFLFRAIPAETALLADGWTVSHATVFRGTNAFLRVD